MATTDDDLNLILQQPEAEAPAEPEASEDVTDEAPEAAEAGDEPDEQAGDDVEGIEEDGDEPAKEEAQDEGQTFTVKVDGEDRQVSLDELTRSYAGQGYIQKRMQENAARQKEVEQVYHAFVQEREMLSHLVQQVQSGQLLTPPQQPDASNREKDPLRYMREMDAYNQRKAAYEQQQAQIQQYSTQQAEAQQRALAAYQAEQMRELSARLPEFADPEKGAVLARQLTQAGASYGFAPEEIGQVSDHRAILILADAMKWRQHQDQREKAMKKAETARPITRPGAQRAGDTSQKRASEAKRNSMRKTGSVDDVAAWLMTSKS